MQDKWYPSEWGPDDEVGALNRISPASVVDATRIVRQGKIYTLGRVLENELPIAPFHGQYFCQTYYSHYTGYDWHLKYFKEIDNGYTAMSTRISMGDNTGTHIDNLNHVGIKDGDDFRLYNGFLSSQITTPLGTSKLGIEKMPPLMSRGVLVDMAGYKQVEMMQAGELISLSDLEGALAKQRTEVRPGDTVLIRTGWGRQWMVDNARMRSGEPGPGMEVGKWLASNKVISVGVDNFGLDVMPDEVKGEVIPVHLHLLTKSGIRIIENMFLEELARDKVYEFLFVCLPVRFKGAAASPVTPIAVT